MTDAELVRLARDGQASAFEQLARRWTARVLAVCRARVDQPNAAEDLAQEALLRGLQHLDTLSQPEKFGPWLRGIAVRVCLDWLKTRAAGPVRQASSEEHPFDPVDGAETPPQQVERADSRQRLLAEIHALPDELRETVLLYYFDDVTYVDLAHLMGVSRATVNARLAKARELLARRLAFLVR
jgi:RNA polymerase sigma-70 factor (ECF subfamily)